MRIAFLESFYGGSHKSFLDGLSKYSAHEIEPFILPARFWKWRLRSAALYFAEHMDGDLQDWDLIIATDMMNIAEFKAISGFRGPILQFFHENQLTYPRPESDALDLHFGFINVASALAADLNLFNSAFQLRHFQDELPQFINRIPEFVPFAAHEKILQKCRVIYMGCDFDQFDCSQSSHNDIPVILWNHRWEFDKQPQVFFKALYQLAEEGIAFRLVILGENFQIHPKEFLEARERLADRIIRFGFVESLEDYARYLSQADIVVSTAIQENFGFAVAEAMFCQTLPLLPNRLSYPEILEEKFHPLFLYNNDLELVQKLRHLLANCDKLASVRQEISRSIARFHWQNRIAEFDRTFDEVAATTA